MPLDCSGSLGAYWLCRTSDVFCSLMSQGRRPKQSPAGDDASGALTGEGLGRVMA
jgi:hypothetical protein